MHWIGKILLSNPFILGILPSWRLIPLGTLHSLQLHWILSSGFAGELVLAYSESPISLIFICSENGIPSVTLKFHPYSERCSERPF